MSRDGVAGLAVLAASLVLFALTLGLKESPLVPVGPGFYPRIVLGVTAGLALLLVATDLLAARRRRAPPAAASSGPAARGNGLLVAASFGVFALYALAMPWIGFRLATFFFVGGLNLLLAPPRGARGWLRGLVLALVTTAVAWYVFERWLLVLLPRGRWTDF